jgi:AcrR family transcriptional regulator
MIREVLIDCALELFSAKGVKGTSGNEIARLGKTTGAMVVYYFKSREQLVEAVVKERLVPLLMPVWDMDWRADAGEIIPELQRRLMKIALSNSYFISLWSREIMSEGGCMRKVLLESMQNAIPQSSGTIFSRLAECVKRGQEKGEIHKALLPEMVFMSIVGGTLVPLFMSNVWAETFGIKFDGEAVAEHIRLSVSDGIFI